MKNRLFGKDSTSVSEIGLGCWQLGADWGDVSEKEAASILETALENGITFFDTADVYGAGRSEQIIGNCLKQEDCFIATKAGRTGDLFPDKYTKQTLRNCVENSLKNLQTDSLDLIQMHCIPFPVMKDGAIWTWLEDFKKDGLIKRYGASVETMDEANWCIDSVPNLYSLQIIFNALRQKPVTTLFDKAQKNRTGIIARVPLASGLLSGKFTKTTSFSESDHRNYNANGDAFNVGETFAGLPFEEGVELSHQLDDLRNSDKPMAPWSLRWILDHPAVTTVIPGASSSKQVLSNVSASEMDAIDEETHQKINKFYTTQVAEKIRGPY